MAKTYKTYKCDPAKNTECSKTNCHINGGECYLTHNKKYEKKKDLILTVAGFSFFLGDVIKAIFVSKSGRGLREFLAHTHRTH